MKRHIIETLLQEVVQELKLGGVIKEMPLFDIVKNRLQLQSELQGGLTVVETESLAYLLQVDSPRPDYKWDIPKTKAYVIDYIKAEEEVLHKYNGPVNMNWGDKPHEQGI